MRCMMLATSGQTTTTPVLAASVAGNPSDNKHSLNNTQPYLALTIAGRRSLKCEDLVTEDSDSFKCHSS